MKKIGIVIMLLLSTTVFFAQNNQRMTPKERQAKTIERLTKSLELSDTQVTQVTAFYDTETTKMEALRSNKDMDREQMRENMKQLTEDTDASITTILTEEQLPKFETYTTERNEKMASRQKQGGDGERKERRERN